MLDREVCQHTYIVGAAARTPSVGDEIYVKINLMSISDDLWEKISLDCDEPRPTNDYNLIMDAIHYIYFWILVVYKRSPLLFFLHLATILCNNPGRTKSFLASRLQGSRH